MWLAALAAEWNEAAGADSLGLCDGRDKQDVKRGALNTAIGWVTVCVRQRARDWRGLVLNEMEHRSDSEAPESPTAGGIRDAATSMTKRRCRWGTRPKETIKR